jgi:MoaA/NifB/PqqE/SkfB family radical SAM enzyme
MTGQHKNENAPEITFLQVEPTTRCNFTCGFCCGRHMDQSDQSWEDFEATMEMLPNIRHIEIQGEGEPLLHPRFFEMAAMARARGIKISTISNGSMFSEKRIGEILDTGISAIMVSIESADPSDFRAIRGGKLEIVEKGITNLLAARNGRGSETPTVGFAMTVLKRTRDQLNPIFELYERLGMDGGILCHLLSDMGAYARHYSDEMRGEVLNEMGQALVWARYAKNIRRPEYRESPIRHFWNDLMAMAKDARAKTEDVAPFRTCPWLDHALYVNRKGMASACPNVKDTSRHGFGHVRSDGIGKIMEARAAMREKLHGGEIPFACEGCFIANSIAHTLKKTTSIA